MTLLFCLILIQTFLAAQSCEIRQVSVQLDACDFNNEIGMVLDFQHTNTSDSFNVSGNGTNYGNFAYADLPVDLGRVDADCSTFYNLIIRDQLIAGCTADLGMGVLCCGCRIYNVSANIVDCRNNTFGLELNFDHDSTGTQFTLTGNGINYGTFNYADLPIQLFPLDADCSTVYEFTIIDVDDPTCGRTIILGEVCCECEITNLNVNPISCVGDSCMTIEIDFDHVGLDSLFHVINQAGQPVDTFAYADLPITIDCWFYNGKERDILAVCDLVDPDCCADIEFENLPCDSCVAFDIAFEVFNCDTNSNHFIRLDFQYDVRGDSGYCVTIEDSTYGPFSYDTTSRVFGPISGGCGEIDTIIVFDKFYSRCRDTTFI